MCSRITVSEPAEVVMTLASLDELLLDHRVKGMPGGVTPFALGRIGQHKWNVLREDLPLPLAVLKERALSHNSAWMRRFLDASGAKISPHGKTTMSPQLFARQLADGAWAMTVATIQQLQVARDFGVEQRLLSDARFRAVPRRRCRAAPPLAAGRAAWSGVDAGTRSLGLRTVASGAAKGAADHGQARRLV
jgi:D-serine deaminase-like pyridoxal phosphate-dependent protein